MYTQEFRSLIHETFYYVLIAHELLFSMTKNLSRFMISIFIDKVYITCVTSQLRVS